MDNNTYIYSTLYCVCALIFHYSLFNFFLQLRVSAQFKFLYNVSILKEKMFLILILNCFIKYKK